MGKKKKPQPPEEHVDPVVAINRVVNSLDPDAVVASTITFVEWIEPDGSYAISVLHSPMPTWHMRGLIGYAAELAEASAEYAMTLGDDDDYEE